MKIFMPTGYRLVWDAHDDVQLENPFGLQVGTALASDEVRAAAIDDRGDLIAIPASFWRTEAGAKSLNARGWPVEFLDANSLLRKGHPVVLDIDLASKFPSIFLKPDLPNVWPKAWGENPFEGHPTLPKEAISQQQPPMGGGKGGRPPKYAWEEFYVEALRYSILNGGIEPEYENDFRQHMKGWMERTWASLPDASLINKKIAEILEIGITKPG